MDKHSFVAVLPLNPVILVRGKRKQDLVMKSERQISQKNSKIARWGVAVPCAHQALWVT